MFNDKQIKTVIAFSIVIFIVMISIFLINTLHNNSLKHNDTKEETILSLTTDSNIFKISSIQIYSSANALNNLETQKDYWDLNVFQYSDIVISIDNHVSIDDLTQKNTIKSLYIDNINYPKLPDKGTPKLYLKRPNLLGIGVINQENLVNNRIDFNVIDENTSDDKINNYYADCSNPIILSAINEDIVKNFIIRNTRSAVTFDGNLLVDSTILLSNIEYTLTFSIHIINNLDEEYICNLEIPIKLSDDNDINTIYDGSYQVILTDIPSGKFYKREN